MMKKEKSKAEKPSPKIFRNGDNRIRSGWLLAIVLILYYGIRLGVRLTSSYAFGALFNAWGVNMSTVLRAPGWAQTIYAWHGSAITAVVGLCMILVSLGLRRFWLKEPVFCGTAPKGGVLLLIGAGYALITGALFLILDSMRLEWPLSKPVFSAAQPVLLAIMLLAAVSEELFSKAVLLDGLKSRWGMAPAVLVSAAVFFLDSAGYAGNIFSGINALLLGVLCCCVYMKYGLWASAGLRYGLGFAGTMIMGFGGSSAESVYRMYHVSDAWLTGGTGGPAHGLWQTVVLLAGLIWMNRETLKRFRIRKR